MAARLATPMTALAVALLTLASTVGALVVAAVDHSVTSTGGPGLLLIIPGFGIVGAVVARRQPRNPIGWCMLCAALFLALSSLGSTYSVLDYRHHHGTLPLGALAVLIQPGWAPSIVLFAFSIVLFPDGHLPSGWWRIPMSALVAFGAIFLGGAYALAVDVIVTHNVRVDSTGNLLQGDKPTGNWAWWGDLQPVFFLLILGVGVAWLVAQIPAYRRATGVRRAQLKWLLLGSGTGLAGGVLSITAGSSFFLGLLGTFALLGIPLGIGIGITRYRLYDIDRLISRTLSYALLTALLVGVFVGLVLLTTRVLPFSSPVGVAASTLLAAALFTPLRNRLQRLVDRRFNRARYDAEATVTAFGARLRDAVDPETVLSELATAASSSLHPAHVSVWVKTA